MYTCVQFSILMITIFYSKLSSFILSLQSSSCIFFYRVYSIISNNQLSGVINGSRRYLTIASTIRQILMASSKTSRKYAKTFRSIYRITHKRSPNYCLSSSASSTDTNVFLALVYHWCEHVSSIFFCFIDYRSNFRGFFFQLHVQRTPRSRSVDRNIQNILMEINCWN